MAISQIISWWFRRKYRDKWYRIKCHLYHFHSKSQKHIMHNDALARMFLQKTEEFRFAKGLVAHKTSVHNMADASCDISCDMSCDNIHDIIVRYIARYIARYPIDIVQIISSDIESLNCRIFRSYLYRTISRHRAIPFPPWWYWGMYSYWDASPLR